LMMSAAVTATYSSSTYGSGNQTFMAPILPMQLPQFPSS
jgi:hypothetical protein